MVQVLIVDRQESRFHNLTFRSLTLSPELTKINQADGVFVKLI